MKGNYFTYSIIVVLILLNIVLLVKRKNDNKTDAGSSQITTNSNEGNLNMVLLKDIYKAQIGTEGFQIDKRAKCINSEGKQIYIKDLLSGGPKLFFNYTSYTCKTCIDDEFIRLRSLANRIDSTNIICISEFEDKRQMFVLNNKYGFEFLNIKNNTLGLPLDNEYFPYIFVSDSSMRISSVYIPTKDYYELGNIYYEEMIYKFFN